MRQPPAILPPSRSSNHLVNLECPTVPMSHGAPITRGHHVLSACRLADFSSRCAIGRLFGGVLTNRWSRPLLLRRAGEVAASGASRKHWVLVLLPVSPTSPWT